MPNDDEGRQREEERAGGISDPSSLRAAVEAAVSGHPEIAAVYLYGSAARERATPLSDVDLGLLFTEPAGSFRDRLATAARIGSAIARAHPDVDVDARDLEELPLAVVGAVLTEGVLVVSNDERRRVDFERETRLRYFDFLPVHRAEVAEANAALRERFRDG